VPAVRWQSAVDFAVLVVAIYLLLKWSREARALRLALSILALRISALLTRQLDLLITSWVLEASAIVALLVLVVGFQPELRRVIMRLDLLGRAAHKDQLPVLAAVAAAASSLAEVRCGALIVIVRIDSIAELVTGGVTIAAGVSPQLLQAVFQKGSPIHDGAAIIDGDRLTHAGVILPLTQRPVPEPYGTRHRAGIGLTERSDALVIVVSEERGETTLMHQGQIQPIAGPDALLAALEPLTVTDSDAIRKGRSANRAMAFGLGAAALGLSALVWSATFLLPGKSVRVQTVPVELTNVPPGLRVAAQSTDTIQVWLRATDFMFDSANLGGLVARCDLAHAHEGVNAVRLQADVFGLPPGVKVEGMAPHELSVRLTTVPSTRPSGG
jgi:diadenylate cyclase